MVKLFFISPSGKRRTAGLPCNYFRGAIPLRVRFNVCVALSVEGNHAASTSDLPNDGTCPPSEVRQSQPKNSGASDAVGRGGGSGCWRSSSNSTGRSSSESGMHAALAASATLLTNIGVVPHSDAQRSHCLSSWSVLAESIIYKIPQRSIRLWAACVGTWQCGPPPAKLPCAFRARSPLPAVISVALPAACPLLPPGRLPARCIA